MAQNEKSEILRNFLCINHPNRPHVFRDDLETENTENFEEDLLRVNRAVDDESENCSSFRGCAKFALAVFPSNFRLITFAQAQMATVEEKKIKGVRSISIYRGN